MTKKLLSVLLLVVGSVLWHPSLAQAQAHCQAIQVNQADAQAFLPDPNCTPGSIDPAVTQDNLAETVCKSGYTTTVRPPASYTNALKKQQIIEYGYVDTQLSSYEEDHLISLELGGNPRDPANLWPEPHASLNEKDTIENYLHEQLCSGKLTLTEAQQQISKNWYQVYLGQHPQAVSPQDLWQSLVDLIVSVGRGFSGLFH